MGVLNHGATFVKANDGVQILIHLSHLLLTCKARMHQDWIRVIARLGPSLPARLAFLTPFYMGSPAFPCASVGHYSNTTCLCTQNKLHNSRFRHSRSPATGTGCGVAFGSSPTTCCCIGTLRLYDINDASPAADSSQTTDQHAIQCISCHAYQLIPEIFPASLWDGQ